MCGHEYCLMGGIWKKVFPSSQEAPTCHMARLNSDNTIYEIINFKNYSKYYP